MKFSPQRIAASLRRRWYVRRIGAAVTGKRGLEIGGPSEVFSPDHSHWLFPPIYALADSIDNCNFASKTVWSEGPAGNTFQFRPDTPAGRQYIHCATSLASIADHTYDFLLASHVLEHVANPLKALLEWRRVLKPDGYALILVPDKQHTFDVRRPYTTFAHLQQDFQQGTPEADDTHLDEILALHDLERDKPAGTPEQFRERSLKNVENRCLHHHVFSPEVLAQCLRVAGLRPLHISTTMVPHIAAFCRVSQPRLSTQS